MKPKDEKNKQENIKPKKGKRSIDYDSLSDEGKKLFDEIKEKKRKLMVLKNRGTWKHMYVEVRAKTLELQKDENKTEQEKLKEMKEYFKTEFLNE